MAGLVARSGARAAGNGRILLAALAFGLLTAALLVAYLREEQRKQATRDAASVAVVVAKKDIPLGANITTAMLEVRLVPPEAAVAAAYSEAGRVAGLRARYPIPAGAQIVPGMVVQGGAEDALSVVVPPGKRALAITGSEVIGGGGHIRPGDRVDVLLVAEEWKLLNLPGPTGSGEQRKGVATVLQNVEVLAVADDVEKIAATGPAERENDDRNKKIRSVVLAVDQQGAQQLFLAESIGRIRLSLRPFGEVEEQPVPPTLRVLPAGATAAPTATPAPR
jgi:pilus assembly protein CpaB